jgi:hypothetical protein
MEAVKEKNCLEVKLKATDSAMEYKLWKKRLIRASKRHGWPLVDLCPFLDETRKMDTKVDEEIQQQNEVLLECLRLYRYIVSKGWKVKPTRLVSKCIQSIVHNDDKVTEETLGELRIAITDPNNAKEKAELQAIVSELQAIVSGRYQFEKKVPKEIVNGRPTKEEEYAMLNFITNSINNNLYMIVCDSDHDPVKLMTAINDNFNRATWARVVSLNNELRKIALKGNESVAAYYQRCLLIKHNLQELTGETNNISFVSHFLLGLPKEYDSPRNQILSRNNVDHRGFTSEEMESMINLIYQCEANVKVQKESSTVLLTHTEKTKPTKKLRCYNCKAVGHGVDKCPLPLIKCKSCGYIGHNESECRRKKVTAQKETAVLFTSVDILHTETRKQNRWVIDCGATTHITNDLNDIKNQKKEMVYVNTVNGTSSPIETTTGILKGKIGGRCIFLNNASHKLLAMSPMISDGWSFVIEKDVCTGRNKDGIQLMFNLNNGLYERDEVTCFHVEEDADPYLVHCALGHSSIEKIRKTLPERTKLWDKNISFSDCETCVMANMKKKGSNRKGSNHPNKENLKKGEYWCLDLIGPMETTSTNGVPRYILNCVDFVTRFGMAYPIVDKRSETLANAVSKLVIYCRNKINVNIRIVHCDQGTEFIGNFDLKMTELGINVSRGAPDSSVIHNGIIERRNRSLVSMLRCNLLHLNLPTKLWKNLVHICNQTLNKLYHEGINDIPYKLFHGVEPTFDYNIIGSKCYYHNMETGKLSKRSRMGFYLGEADGSLDGVIAIYNKSTDEIIQTRSFKVYNNQGIGSDKLYVGLKVEVAHNDGNWYAGFIREIHTDQKGTKYFIKFLDNDEDWFEDVENIRKMEINTLLNTSIITTPTTIKEAKSAEDSDFWKRAILNEWDNLFKMNVFKIIKKSEIDQLPRIMKTKYVFKVKYDEHGVFEKRKCRLTACGYSQLEGIDFVETSSPVISKDEFRVLMNIAVQLNMKINKFDVQSAFLEADSDSELYINIPSDLDWLGLKEKFEGAACLQLNKQLYGTKQASRTFYRHMKNELKSIEFLPCQASPCIFKHKNKLMYVGLYVDDLIVIYLEEDQEIMSKQLSKLGLKMRLKDLGEPTSFLNQRILRNPDSMNISQQIYVDDIVKKFELIESKSVKVPIDDINTEDIDGEILDDNKLYQSMLGCCLYMVQCTRPDIAVAVSVLGSHSTKPSKKQLNMLKKVVKYLKGTKNLGIRYVAKNDREPLKLIAYSDSDYAAATDRRSRSGILIFINDGLVDWASNKQKSVSLSTCEAEYIAMASAARKLYWLTQLLDEMNIPYQVPILKVDNQAAKNVAINDTSSKRTKHIDVRHHYVREMVNNNKLKIEYVSTDNMLSDIMTKVLNTKNFEYQRDRILDEC